MQAENLIMISGPRGVDLAQAAGTAATKKKSDGTLRKNGATILVPPPASRALGSETRTFERPAWSIAELGQAAVGVPDLEFRAACYAFAGDRSHYWPLQRALAREAHELAAERDWPLTVASVHGLQQTYLLHLAKLVLDEDARPEPFRTVPELFAVYLFVERATWNDVLAERFADLKAVWLDWLQNASRVIQQHLADGDGEVCD